jgi:hypothetical protein
MQSQVSGRVLYVVVIAAVLAVLVLLLTSSARHEAGLGSQVIAAEAGVAQATQQRVNEVQTLRTNLAAASQQLAVIRNNVPAGMDPAFFDKVAQVAAQSGIVDFRYQRKTDTTVSMQAGVWTVYRYSIAALGTKAQLSAFLDGFYKISGPTTVIDNMLITPSGANWQLTADISIYTYPM